MLTGNFSWEAVITESACRLQLDPNSADEEEQAYNAGQEHRSQLKLVGLYSEEEKMEPQINAKLDTWKEDLAKHMEKVEEAKKVLTTQQRPLIKCLQHITLL